MSEFKLRRIAPRAPQTLILSLFSTSPPHPYPLVYLWPLTLYYVFVYFVKLLHSYIICCTLKSIYNQTKNVINIYKNIMMLLLVHNASVSWDTISLSYFPNECLTSLSSEARATILLRPIIITNSYFPTLRGSNWDYVTSPTSIHVSKIENYPLCTQMLESWWSVCVDCDH